jgi:hypothetical protein
MNFTTNMDSHGRKQPMFSRIRKHLTFANVAATIAVFFAISGGAYAASKYLITSTKQISPKVLKSLVGKTGKAGVPGAQGPAGSTGPAGPQGPAGAAGKGEPGSEGKVGPAGPEGKPGVTGFTKTLPKGETEMGDWSLIKQVGGEERVFTAVSFNIPLKQASTAHYIRVTGEEPFYNATTKKEEERSQPACKGTAEEPAAAPGNLCVYGSANEEDLLKNTSEFVFPMFCPLSAVAGSLSAGGACYGVRKLSELGLVDRVGFALEALSVEAGILNVAGTWAVTAE